MVNGVAFIRRAPLPSSPLSMSFFPFLPYLQIKRVLGGHVPNRDPQAEHVSAFSTGATEIPMIFPSSCWGPTRVL